MITKREWKKLYKKTSTGKIQVWSIWVVANNDGTATIFTEYGQDDGKQQRTEDVIRDGKNIGKANETDPWTQACLEADASHKLKLKSGYVNNAHDAISGKLDEIIEGGTEPMLAHAFDKKLNKVHYPCAVQPKLDGIRCIAVVENCKCTLWTRTRKPITTCQHIIEAIERFGFSSITLDGELYNHALKDDFEQVVSAVRGGHDASELVQYHIYDIVGKDVFRSRNRFIELCHFSSPLVAVETSTALSEHEVRMYRKQYADAGYEGVMVRNWDSLYKHGRSNDLLKLKEFEDAEFRIIDVAEGRGRMAGKGIFVCVAPNGAEFRVKQEGSLDSLTLEDLRNDIGKMLTVRYQNFTTYGVPRFPIGVAVRDYE